jgi:hypothetical protein
MIAEELKAMSRNDLFYKEYNELRIIASFFYKFIFNSNKIFILFKHSFEALLSFSPFMHMFENNSFEKQCGQKFIGKITGF